MGDDGLISKVEFVIGVGFGGAILVMIGVALATINWPLEGALAILSGTACLGVMLTELSE